MVVDPKCLELAEYFSDYRSTEFDKIILAQEIQDTVIDWMRAANTAPQWMQWAIDP